MEDIYEELDEISLEEEYLLEMAYIGDLQKKKNGKVKQELEVYVQSRDEGGNLPHVYIRDVMTHGKEFNSCICLETPDYFKHKGKTDTLDNDFKNLFVDLMMEKSEDFNMSNWEFACRLWNSGTRGRKIDLTKVTMPDYTLLD